MAQTNTRKLTEVSLFTAVTVILMIISIAVPVLGEAVGIFAPLPIIILCIRYDYLSGSTAAVMGIIISSAILTIPMALPIGVLYWIVGLIMGFSAKKNKDFKITILLLTAGVLIAFLFNLLIYTLFIDKSGLLGIIKTFVNAFRAELSAVSPLVVNTQSISNLKQIENLISVDNLLLFVPVCFIAYSAFYAYLSYLGTGAVLKRLRFYTFEKPSITKLYIDYWFVVVLLIAFASGYLLSLRGYTAGKYIYNTGIFLIVLSIGLQGFSVAAYYFIEKLKTPAILAIIILLIPVLLQAALLYTYIGIMDMFLDLRRLNPARIFKF